MQRLLTLIISLTLLTTPALALDLIDSKKQVMGTVTDMVDGDRPGYIWVARQQGDATYLLYCNRQECLSDDFVEYENDDCTGESGIRIFDMDTERDVLWLAAFAPDGTIRMSKKSPRFPPRNLTVCSYWHSHDGGVCVVHGEPYTGLFAHTDPVGSLATYAPPFVIRTPRMK
jgi:hypothetical protein